MRSTDILRLFFEMQKSLGKIPVYSGGIMYNFGNIVAVKAFPNLILERRVVGVKNSETIYLCNEDEFQSALKAHREPTSIGFPIYDVVELKDNERKTA